MRRHLLLFSSAVLFAACDPSAYDLFRKAPGNYLGYLIDRTEGQTRTIPVKASCTETLIAEPLEDGMKPEPGQERYLFVCDLRPQAESDIRQWRFEVEPQDLGDAALRLGGDFGENFPLPIALGKLKEGCFTESDRSPGTRVCFDGYEISIDSDPAFALVLNRELETQTPVFEEPRSFTLPELLRHARDRSFESRLQFEQVVQGRLAAQDAHADLLPRIAVGDVLGLASFNWQSLLRSAGNLAPFLFPSRWVRARASEMGYAADKMAWLAMRADSAQIAESLGLAILRDQESLAALNDTIPRLEALRMRILDDEWLGTLPPGASDSINHALLAIRNTHLHLAATVQQERAALAQVLGMMNPAAVREIRLPADFQFVSLQNVAVDLSSLQRDALLRSVELRQMEFLIREAELERRARTLDWIDLSGANSGLGAGTPTYVAVARNRIEELKVLRERLQSVVVQKVDALKRDLQTALAANALAQESFELQSRRLARLELEYEFGMNISLFEWQALIQDKMKAELERIGARYEAQGALARVNRLLFLGDYLDLRPVAPRAN